MGDVGDELVRSDADPFSVGERLDALTEALLADRRVLAGVLEELRGLRGAVHEVIARLDEGLELTEEVVAPLAVPPAVTDLLAALRDDVTAGFDSLRRDLPERADGETGPVSDHVLDEVRADLAEIRRRIKLRAEGRVLSDEQISRIAEVVVQRLAQSETATTRTR
jgi:hypothetical protein